ncbi:hypothetical protein OHA61_30780 [Streptomyces sp. NBC_00885]|uniref:hypothetical protein n=1 Tax=Streptomyces sp. NBC_00885 TaxID=2975857 RepID=UPI0038642073|nr:hypothetical protein OHA61_30780 [Streptomyces sp. NBC_00885]
MNSVDGEVMSWVIVAFLCVIFVFHAAWALFYFGRFRRCKGEWKGALTDSVGTLVYPDESDAITLEMQSSVVERNRQFDTCLLGGAVGTTAWSALYVGSTSTGSSFALSNLSLYLLLAGVIVLLAGPLLTRKREPYFSAMIYDSAIYVGFTSLVFALFSITIDLAGTALDYLALFFAAAVVVSSGFHVWDQCTTIRTQLLRHDFATCAHCRKHNAVQAPTVESEPEPEAAEVEPTAAAEAQPEAKPEVSDTEAPPLDKYGT